MELPYYPSDTPFNGEQKAWLAGFLAGLNTRLAMPAGAAVPTAGAVGGPVATLERPADGTAAEPAAAEAAAPAGPGSLLIIYGTQSGNAEWIADQAKDAATELGFDVTLADMGEATLEQVAGATKLLAVVSTYGEGEMPDDAEDLWSEIAGPEAPRMEGVSFAVCGLGDTIYDGFCQAAKNLDARLAALGATRVVDRAECDIDFQPAADAWMPGALDALLAAGSAPAAAPVAPVAEPAAEPVAEPAAEPVAEAWGRKNPYPATIIENTVLSGPASAKEVRHFVVSLGDSGIEYEPGDGLSVHAVNDAALVELVLARLGATGDELITDRKTERTLRDALTNHYELATPSKYLVDYIASRSGDAELTHLSATGDHEALDAWLWGRDVLDLLNVDPTLTITPEELVNELRPLAPRVYSISSSPRAHAGTVHLTVAAVRYRSLDRDRGGVCSTFLADRCGDGAPISVYITPNRSFRLPDDDAPVIMIGPGTGVAPFRSFLHERAARGATGENWLFFGDQHRESDYLYAEELARFTDDGLLTRLDLAFSRDQEHKIYVQDRMAENGAEFYDWLERGASVFVCGDATRMAHDVDTALHEIVAKQGGLDADGAAHYVDQLKQQKRYLRDVY
ncbi:sulfite reductase subunit alpha [Gordonia crocea]|uniref:assimilatory sulfite reductase (NADPH) n=1 Tax=Gordonia crocea TaxID=589162 RepID=A0A7I9UWB9_9ACTN|nr:sulfite reductase subunit alpha [Gordonia crocea]GED97435.1 putative sulfite reductase [Gordonia crocea]